MILDVQHVLGYPSNFTTRKDSLVKLAQRSTTPITRLLINLQVMAQLSRYAPVNKHSNGNRQFEDIFPA